MNFHDYQLKENKGKSVMAVLLQEQDDGTCPFKVGGSWNMWFRNCSLKVVGFGLGLGTHG